jgi:ubiquinone/menaquinone biosynthesis C-methylase UbiE
MPDEPIALDAYEQLADPYAARVDTKAHNAYYELPAMLELLPDVRGQQALDAACGPGRYSEWLTAHGADVTSFDVSPRMLTNARQRLGSDARLIQHDLNQPLTFLDDASMDLVVCALALDYVRDWPAVLNEFSRALRQRGALVFSIEHPISDYSLWRARDYFRVERVEYTWRGFGEPVVVPSFRRPLMDVFNALSGAGFCVDRVLEPRPQEEFQEQDPEEYQLLMKRPGFLCLRAWKL